MPSSENRAPIPPRDDLCREAPFAFRADPERADGDGLTLDGYAAVFNRETIIDSWEGKFREKISPGAMRKSFKENPPRIQFDHGRHPLVGSIPIARNEPGYPREETDPDLAPEGGAHVVARLFDNWLVQPVREAIAEQAINGMSFRFSVVREHWFDATGKRITDEETLREALRRTWYEDVPDEELLLRDLKELRVPEAGPVVWPAYTDTSVGVRSVTIDLGRLHDPSQRSILARAVLLADVAERGHNEGGPHDPQPLDTDDTRTSEDTSAVEHREDDSPSDTDTPRTTDAPASAGEHESRPVRASIDDVRNTAARLRAYISPLT